MATIRKLLILVKRDFGSKPIWLTEYGYQTNPPDRLPRRASQAAGDDAQPRSDARLAAARVTMFFQYLYRDEPK